MLKSQGCQTLNRRHDRVNVGTKEDCELMIIAITQLPLQLLAMAETDSSLY